MSRFEEQLAAVTHEMHRQDQALATAQQSFAECLVSELDLMVPGHCVDAIREAFESPATSTFYNFGAIRA